MPILFTSYQKTTKPFIDAHGIMHNKRMTTAFWWFTDMKIAVERYEDLWMN